MAKKHRTTTVTRQQAQTYLSKALEFLLASKEAMMDSRFNSAGLLAVHSAISSADSLLDGVVKKSIKQDVRVACILGWGWHQANSLRLAGEGNHPPPRKMAQRDFLRG